jgi:hypothetical protein
MIFMLLGLSISRLESNKADPLAGGEKPFKLERLTAVRGGILGAFRPYKETKN